MQVLGTIDCRLLREGNFLAAGCCVKVFPERVSSICCARAAEGTHSKGGVIRYWSGHGFLCRSHWCFLATTEDEARTSLQSELEQVSVQWFTVLLLIILHRSHGAWTIPCRCRPSKSPFSPDIWQLVSFKMKLGQPRHAIMSGSTAQDPSLGCLNHDSLVDWPVSEGGVRALIYRV